MDFITPKMQSLSKNLALNQPESQIQKNLFLNDKDDQKDLVKLKKKKKKKYTKSKNTLFRNQC